MSLVWQEGHFTAATLILASTRAFLCKMSKFLGVQKYKYCSPIEAIFLMVWPPLCLYSFLAYLAAPVAQTPHSKQELSTPSAKVPSSHLTVLSSVIMPAALRRALVQQVTSMSTTTPTASHVHQGTVQSAAPAVRTITCRSSPVYKSVKFDKCNLLNTGW